jgi:hypothetical protein
VHTQTEQPQKLESTIIQIVATTLSARDSPTLTIVIIIIIIIAIIIAITTEITVIILRGCNRRNEKKRNLKTK